MSAEKYRHAEQAAQQRQSEFLQSNDCSLANEIASCKVMFEQSLQTGNVGQSLAILNVLGGLIKASRLAAYQQNELLAKSVIRKWAFDAGAIIADELQKAYCPSWEDVADSIVERILASLSTVANEASAKAR